MTESSGSGSISRSPKRSCSSGPSGWTVSLRSGKRIVHLTSDTSRRRLAQRHDAFTAPGRYIYVTGRLMEYCPGEASLAFTIAHELAHHDLGHLRYFPRWFRGLAAHWITEIIFLVVHGVQHFFYSRNASLQLIGTLWISVSAPAGILATACTFSISWRTGYWTSGYRRRVWPKRIG